MNDAHLHLQDSRFGEVETIVSDMRSQKIQRCVVNGTSSEDWIAVQKLSLKYPDLVIPSYGLHPWKTPFQESSWKDALTHLVTQSPLPCIGECGLDRWMDNPDKVAQEDAFLFQLELANKLNAPLSIHVLKAWEWFMELLRSHTFPKRGFLLHSYNGSKELLSELIERGAYFSFSGYYLQEKKVKQQEVYRAIPLDRLLVETDAPDMLPPDHVITHPLSEDKLNHPANLPSIAQHLAKLLDGNSESLNNQLDRNFSDFFLER